MLSATVKRRGSFVSTLGASQTKKCVNRCSILLLNMMSLPKSSKVKYAGSGCYIQTETLPRFSFASSWHPESPNISGDHLPARAARKPRSPCTLQCPGAARSPVGRYPGRGWDQIAANPKTRIIATCPYIKLFNHSISCINHLFCRQFEDYRACRLSSILLWAKG